MAEVYADPDGMRKAAKDFEAATDEIAKILKKLTTATESRGTCWGDDKTGREFANGPKGYLAGRDNLFDSLDNNADRIGEQMRELRKAAAAIDAAEDSNMRRFKKET